MAVSPLTATSISQGTSAGMQQSSQQGSRSSQSQSSSFIPNYSETPILDSLAQYAEKMAPQVYSWGMQQYGNNQGDINELRRSADTLASGQRLAADVGQAEAGVQQSGAQALKNSKEELEGFGIDPSSGRYAALDQASRVQTAAAAAGAGNMQRTSDIATSNAMKNQAISSELQNSNFGLGVAGAANNFTATGLSLKYPPLGQTSESSGEGTNTGESSGVNSSQNYSISGGLGTGVGKGSGGGNPLANANNTGAGMAAGGPVGHSVDPNNYDDVDPSWESSDDPVDYGTGHGSRLSNRGHWNGNNFVPDEIPASMAAGGLVAVNARNGCDENNGNTLQDPFTDGGRNTNSGYDAGGLVAVNARNGCDENNGNTLQDPFTDGGRNTNSGYAEGGLIPGGYDPAQVGSAVEQGQSPSGGGQVDDVPARLSVGEFVLPNDVVKWKGEEYFQKLISQSRQARESVMQMHGQTQNKNLGGAV